MKDYIHIYNICTLLSSFGHKIYGPKIVDITYDDRRRAKYDRERTKIGRERTKIIFLLLQLHNRSIDCIRGRLPVNNIIISTERGQFSLIVKLGGPTKIARLRHTLQQQFFLFF